MKQKNARSGYLSVLMCLLSIFIILSLFGCSDHRPEMKAFNDDKLHVMRDEATGKKYAIQHDMGTVYRVRELS